MTNLLSCCIEGSILDPENYRELQRARDCLQRIKEEKLLVRHNKYNSGIAYSSNVFNHLIEETKELLEAIEVNNLDGTLEEIADVINCAEILAAILLKNKVLPIEEVP